ncbi:MAG: glycosyltransferase family 4 protein [Fibrobacter sp.]|nr:glycosyltransferase family 4 protein [Fibrobacter sp.]
MRILVLNYEYPPLGGGAGNATYFLSREWGCMGIVTDIITTWFTGLDEITHESNNVTVYRVKSRRQKVSQSNPREMISYILKAYKKAKELLVANKYDLSIAFFSIPSGIISYRLHTRFKIPYYVLLRGGDVPGFLGKELERMHSLIMPITKLVWKHATRIIANSRQLADLADKTAVQLARKVEIIPNGVDTTQFFPDLSKHQSFFTFLFTGRFVRQKNVELLLQQFDKALQQCEARLILAGDGPMKETLVLICKLSPRLMHHVEIRHWVPKCDLLTLYQSAHCFINPSTDEGMPNTVLEAMACGLPVIASNIGGNNELVRHGKNGFLFNLSEPDALCNCIISMMTSQDYNQMSFFSCNYARNNYSWSETAAKILKGADDNA